MILPGWTLTCEETEGGRRYNDYTIHVNPQALLLTYRVLDILIPLGRSAQQRTARREGDRGADDTAWDTCQYYYYY